MDANRFDAMTRAFNAVSTRRRVVRALPGVALGAAFAAVGLGPAAAKGCAPCHRKQHGRCRKAPNNAACGRDGRCLNGACNAPPMCTGAGIFNCAVDGDCCSGSCSGSGCQASGPGGLCHDAVDCGTVLNCVGYRCR